MSFDDLARDVAGTLSGVFGNRYWYTRPGGFAFEVQAVVRRDVDVYDDYGQVVGRTNTVRIAREDIEIVPERGDTLSDGCDVWTLGKALANDGYSYVHEATT